MARAPGQQQDTSVDAVADMLSASVLARANPKQPTTTDDNPPSEGIDDDQTDSDDTDTEDLEDEGGDDQTTDDEDEGDDEDGQSTPDDQDEEADDPELDDDSDEGADEETDEGDDDQDEAVAYSDDDVLEVTVDGETREVSLRDLKAAYSGEGAIEKRLKEATEARKEAQALREQVVTQSEEQRTRLLQTVSALDQYIFAPMVEKPDAALRTKNPQEYMLQKDAYEEDQKRIETSRQQLAQYMQAQMQEQQNARQAFRKEQQQMLVEKIPELRNPQQAKQVQSEIALAIETYGFRPEQVAEVDNHAVFLMARDAGRYLRMQKLKDQARKTPAKGNEGTKKRKLRPGGPTTTKLDAVRKAKQKQQTEAQARKTGKPDDVATMLAATAKTRGRTNGRKR